MASSNVAELQRTTKELLSDITQKIGEYTKERDAVCQLQQPVTQSAPFVISFVGKFKTGKSSLINALIGRDILPTRATTATAVVTRILKGDSDKAWIREKGKEHQVSFAVAQDTILNSKVRDIKNPVEVIFELPIPWLDNDVELRDTPGMDDSSQDGALEAIALNALNDTDLCVCVYDASSMISSKERERTKEIYRQMGGNVVYAINCTNRLNSIERIHEVEDLAKSFFQSMKYNLPNMGAIYMMCSASKMIDLDGFDQWMIELSGPNQYVMRATIRKATSAGQMMDCCNRLCENASQLQALLTEKLTEVNTLHRVDLQERRAIITRNQQNDTIAIRNTVSQAQSLLSNFSSNALAELLNAIPASEDYSDASEHIVKGFFRDKYKSYVSSKWSWVYRQSDFSIIAKQLSCLSFPGRYYTTIQATSDEKRNWSIGGAIFGGALTILTGGAALPLILGGAALGRAIGGSDNGQVDQSVQNTLQFVNESVVPMLRSGIQEISAQAITKAKSDASAKSQKCLSGLEDTISSINNTKQELESFITTTKSVSIGIA